MEIVIIGSAHPLRGGGITTFNERLATELMSQGHNVRIYSFSLQYPSFLFPGKTQFTDEPPPKGLTIHSVINSINPLNWISVGNRIKREKPDLVIVRYWLPFMGPGFGTILRLVKKNKHTKVIGVMDNLIPHEKRPGDVAFTKYFVKPIDAFIAMSRKVLADLKEFTNKPSVYTPHPLYDNYGEGVTKEAACKKLDLPANEKYILFFGFIREYKGLDLLLQAMTDERIKAQNIKLIVAGEYYGDSKLYLDIIEQNKLEDSVKLFTDFIPNDEVRYYFGAADLVVQPYRSATNSGITAIAYHFEKPMVVTNVGGLAEVVPDGKVGFVCESNPTAIADAILKFYQPNSLPGFEQNVVEEKRKYGWGEFVEVVMGMMK
jgi:glycosyltransferase involved in cell wall biosynthesis